MHKPHISTADIVRMYQSGKTSYEVAKHFGCAQPTVIYRLRAAGVRRRNKWERHASESPETAIELYKSGIGVPTIAKRIGVTSHAIYVRLRNAGVPIRKDSYPTRRGAANASWKGGRHISRGYVLVNVGAKNYKFEHRIVMEQMLGRTLRKHEIVHHMNGVRTDNRPENLAVTTLKEHEHYTYVKRLQARIRDLEDIIQKNHGIDFRARVRRDN